jgi:hypothetical protein
VNTALEIKGGISLQPRLPPHMLEIVMVVLVGGDRFFPCNSSQNLCGTAMRSPMMERLSLEGGKHPGDEERELDWLREEAAKNRKALLKELRN